MPAKYEMRVVCDNCGRLVKRQTMDAAQFAAQVNKANLPAMGAEDDRATGDLVAEEGDRPIEVFIHHVSVCGRCQESL